MLILPPSLQNGPKKWGGILFFGAKSRPGIGIAVAGSGYRWLAAGTLYPKKNRIIHQEAEGGWQSSRNSRSAVVRCVCFTAGIWCLGQALEISRPRGLRRSGHQPGCMWRMRRASGQAAAKANRIREAVSMTRLPSLKRRSRRWQTRRWRARALWELRLGR